MSSNVRRFEDLIAWQKARTLIKLIYEETNTGSFARDFRFRDQIRSAALSISSNIAEGFERGRRAEFHQFLSQAKSSCAEVRSQLYSAFDVKHIDEETLRRLLHQAEEVGRIIGGLRRAVARSQHPVLSTQYSVLQPSASDQCSPKT